MLTGDGHGQGVLNNNGLAIIKDSLAMDNASSVHVRAVCADVPVRRRKTLQLSSVVRHNTEHQPLYYLKHFYSLFGRIFQICCFQFFWPKRPSTRARTVVPLTTPLYAVYIMNITDVKKTLGTI